MVKSSVSDERTVSLPQRHRLLFSTSHPNSFPMTDSPEEPRELSHKDTRQRHRLRSSSRWALASVPACCLPAAGSSVGLRAFLLLGLLVELGQDEAVPALD